MRLLSLPFTIVKSAATAITDTAGAMGGAVINGAAGGIRGAATGAAHGLNTGSRSPTTAAITLAAVGATGLVDWPVIIFVGGTGLLIRQLTGRPRVTPAIATPTKATAPAVAPTPKAAPTPAVAPTPKMAPTPTVAPALKAVATPKAAKTVKASPKAKASTSPAKPRPRR